MRMLTYVLGRRPYEFGLVPDSKGFVVYKELLQALHEEPGWRYVRQSHINEVLFGKGRDLFEPEDKGIRARETQWKLGLEKPSLAVPAVLYTAVRNKAHPVVMERGLKSASGRYLMLTPGRDMALRVGKRRDHEPVVLEVVARDAESKGVRFHVFGDLFLATEIPPEFISGPLVSKEVLEGRKRKGPPKEKPFREALFQAPGTFVLDAERDPALYRGGKGRKRKGWKEEARKMRKDKRGRTNKTVS